MLYLSKWLEKKYEASLLLLILLHQHNARKSLFFLTCSRIIFRVSFPVAAKYWKLRRYCNYLSTSCCQKRIFLIFLVTSPFICLYNVLSLNRNRIGGVVELRNNVINIVAIKQCMNRCSPRWNNFSLVTSLDRSSSLGYANPKVASNDICLLNSRLQLCVVKGQRKQPHYFTGSIIITYSKTWPIDYNKYLLRSF